MEKSTRRSFIKPKAGLPAAATALGSVPDALAGEGTSRRAFLQGTAGAAAGAAAIIATPKVAAIALDAAPGAGVPVEPKAVVVTPSGPAAREPVTAYVRNAERSEVTVMSGKHETTYTDPVLAKRLLDAAR
jgi:hypothetical protein